MDRPRQARLRKVPNIVGILVGATLIVAAACAGPEFTLGADGGSSGGPGTTDLESGGGPSSLGGSGNPSGGSSDGSGGTLDNGGAGGASGGENTGGTLQGGSSGRGGASSSGGARSTGGNSSNGGTTSTGGSSTGGSNRGGSGGTISTGGNSSNGGTTSTGGSNKGGSAGSNAGQTSSGGARSGGASGLGGILGNGGTGGVIGAGGLGVAGLAGTGGGSAQTFPSTAILDPFNRANGAVGTSWLGATSAFAIQDQRLRDVTSAGYPILWNASFGATQEAFATFVGFNDTAREINVVMKAQQTDDCELIEVLYHPDSGQVGVEYCTAREWTTLTTVNVTFAPGDRLGARATAAGDVLVFVNGAQVATFDVRGFPHYQAGGRIGVNSAGGAGEATWDDFGGGTATP